MSQPSNPSDGRTHERRNVLFAANLSIGDSKVDCEIINISFGGAQVRVSRAMKAGDKITMEIDPFGTYNMEVRWCRKPDVGLKFDDDQTKVAELVMAIATYA
jgi:hypothetical protein